MVRERKLRQELETIRRLAQSPNQAVHIGAIVTLAEWRDEGSRPLFKTATDSSLPRLQRAGAAALAKMERDADIGE